MPADGSAFLSSWLYNVANFTQGLHTALFTFTLIVFAPAQRFAAAAPAAAPAAAAGRRGEGVVPNGELKIECENGLRWKVSARRESTRIKLIVRDSSYYLHCILVLSIAVSQVDFVANNKASPLHLTDVSPKQDIYIYASQNAVIYVDSKVGGRCCCCYMCFAIVKSCALSSYFSN